MDVDDEGVPYVRPRGVAGATITNPYGLADAIQRDREHAEEIERWQVERRMIWDEIRACPACVRGPSDLDRPTWRHCLDHLAQLSDHAADRPY